MKHLNHMKAKTSKGKCLMTKKELKEYLDKVGMDICDSECQPERRTMAQDELEKNMRITFFNCKREYMFHRFDLYKENFQKEKLRYDNIKIRFLVFLRILLTYKVPQHWLNTPKTIFDSFEKTVFLKSKGRIMRVDRKS